MCSDDDLLTQRGWMMLASCWSVVGGQESMGVPDLSEWEGGWSVVNAFSSAVNLLVESQVWMMDETRNGFFGCDGNCLLRLENQQSLG